MYATGGGALKFAGLVQAELGITMQPQDEMRSLINGLNFLLLEVPYEVFSYSAATPMQFHDTHLRAGRFPYLLVNIGSGVSILKVHPLQPARFHVRKASDLQRPGGCARSPPGHERDQV